jgi:hypothetical protein
MLDDINSKINISMLNEINVSGCPNKRYEWSYSKTSKFRFDIYPIDNKTKT